MLAEEAPKVTDWMQAWGSLAGLLMSTVAVLFTGLLFRHEVRVRREERRDAEAAQARLVLAVRTGPEPAGSRATVPPSRVGYRVLNFSGAPVLDVLIRYVWAGGSVGPTHHLPVLVGEEQGELRVPADLDPHVTEALADFSAIEIIFTDASGQKWQRVDRSAPVRLVERQYRNPGALSVVAVAAGIMLAALLAGVGLSRVVH
ncbi:hypothetical protein GCE86_02825 [Micromonospora terminaliae]|uniref:Uncharacterized protein n=1 Tax=Micromonospora terminaliae TaxID=1914461 RepID=A0AAJ2ZLC1_9ACTN|nr:hypothetical protein [Micromonospora terminaliae]NES31746.1 hypothetical protein [Micromonospora terminaliae]QGL46075.1 hypothetical protein GCE86_02825 [Micromonospora terminaliae]